MQPLNFAVNRGEDVPEIPLRGISLTLLATFYFILIGVVVSAPYTLVFGAPLEFDLLPWLIGIGIFTAIQQVSKTSIQNSGLPARRSVAIGTLRLQCHYLGHHPRLVSLARTPTFSVVIGTAVVIASDVFIGLRERQAQLTVL